MKVENFDTTVEKICSLGGKAELAGDVANNGRMAMCHDLNGGAFDIRAPKTMPGINADS